jgi:uncharacterized protein
MKYTLLLSQHCNLACDYCYVAKKRNRMPLGLASKVVEFAFEHTPPWEEIQFGFFGGEPLLEFSLIREITALIEEHPGFDPNRVKLAMVTNGTIFSPEIADFVRDHRVSLAISCDGPPAIHDRFRRFTNGRATSRRVERTVREALEALTLVPVNAVYRPETLESLPTTIDYFSGLGVRQIYLNPDFSAAWSQRDLAALPGVFRRLSGRYMRYFLEDRPHFISPLDSKIAVILRGGYQPIERCRMGKGEFAFTPEGDVYPCERLVGGNGTDHRIGKVNGGVKVALAPCLVASGERHDRACTSCGLRPYCMNWCGCSNFFMSGHYDRVSSFLCASERVAIESALGIFRTLQARLGPVFAEHLGGQALTMSSRI